MEKPSLDKLRIERRPEKESSFWRWVIIVVLVAILAAAAWFFWSNHGVSVDVRTAAARELKSQAAGTVLNASGYVTARRQATVSSKFTGKVTGCPDRGRDDWSKQGQVLARLDDANVPGQLRTGGSATGCLRNAGLKETDALLQEAQAQLTTGARRPGREKDLASEAELDRNRARGGFTGRAACSGNGRMLTWRRKPAGYLSTAATGGRRYPGALCRCRRGQERPAGRNDLAGFRRRRVHPYRYRDRRGHERRWRSRLM